MFPFEPLTNWLPPPKKKVEADIIRFEPSNDIFSPELLPNKNWPLPLIQAPLPLTWLVGGVEPNANAPPAPLINLTVPVEAEISFAATFQPAAVKTSST